MSPQGQIKKSHKNPRNAAVGVEHSKKRSAEKNGGFSAALLHGYYTQKSAISQHYFYAVKNHRFLRNVGKGMKQLRIMFLFAVGVLCIHRGSVAASVASRAYVDGLSGGKESLSNKTDTLTAESTSDQYPNAKTVYDGLSYRVDTRGDAEQTLAGKYTVSGELSVPDQPLPTTEE